MGVASLVMASVFGTFPLDTDFIQENDFTCVFYPFGSTLPLNDEGWPAYVDGDPVLATTARSDDVPQKPRSLNVVVDGEMRTFTMEHDEDGSPVFERNVAGHHVAYRFFSNDGGSYELNVYESGTAIVFHHERFTTMTMALMRDGELVEVANSHGFCGY